MYTRGAFCPVPAPLATNYVRSPVLAPARVPVQSFTGSEPVLRNRSVRRRARVRLVPCVVAEPPAAISSPAGEKALANVLPGTKRRGRALQAEPESEGSDREGAGISSKGRTSADDAAAIFRVGMPHTSETRKKISAANKGRVPWNKGRKHSEETKRKIAAATRRAMSHPDTRARLKNIATGRKHSPATKQKIASACVRSRAVRGSSRNESELENGERPIVFGSTVHRAKKERHVPFNWKSDTVSALNKRIHTRACAVEFKKFGTQGVSDAGDRARRPMSAETRAKLSARIKELWADPDYRKRVSSGVKRVFREKGAQRPPLTEEHRENIRQSLLKRNASLRREDALARRPKSGRRESAGGRSDLVGSKLAGQVVSDEYGKYLAARKKEDSKKEKQGKGIRQKERAAKKTGKQEMEARRCAAEQRVEDGLLLEALASAGQLPPLSDKNDVSLVSGLPQYPDVFGSDGMYEAGTGALFEAVNGSSAADQKETLNRNRLIFSGGIASYLEDENSDMGAGGVVADQKAVSDFDVYAPGRAEADDDSDGRDDEHAVVAFNSSDNSDSFPSEAAVSATTGAPDDCGNVVLDSEEDVESLLAEVAQAESASSSGFVANETEPAVRADEVEDEVDDVWIDSDSTDAIVADGVGPDTAAPSAPGSLDNVSQDFVGDATHSIQGLSVNAALCEHRESVSAVASNTPDDDRKRVVTYVNGVAEFRFVD